MADNVVMRATNVSKKFCRSLKHMMFYGAQDIARNAVGLSSRSDRLRDGEFWAVADISFELKRGETLGIIGPNGSGKSTMLKMLNGIFMPDRGKIEINGRVGALIEVGAGFHPMLSGRENIYINGSILGMSKKEIDEKFDEIVEFADIGDFIDSPVKHYSSGMHARLGFSIAAHLEPELLLIDEVLSVGDVNFQAKSIRKMEEIRRQNIGIVFVSHNIFQIERICHKVVFLNHGEFVDIGEPTKIIPLYLKQMQKKTLIEMRSKKEKTAKQPSKRLEILNAQVRSNNPEGKVYLLEPIEIEVFYEAFEEIVQPIISIRIYKENIYLVVEINNSAKKDKLVFPKGKGSICCTLPKPQLHCGVYSVEVKMAAPPVDTKSANPIDAISMPTSTLDAKSNLCQFEVKFKDYAQIMQSRTGICYTESKWGY